MGNGRKHKSDGRGRGRGNGRGRGRGRGSDFHQQDFILQKWPEIEPIDNLNRNGLRSPSRGARGGPSSYPGSGFSTPRGRGRGRGDDRGFSRGQTLPRGRGRGRGNYAPNPKLNQNAPLSTLLYLSRPLLRPIQFVPSVFTKTLFEEVDEILRTTAKDEAEGGNDLPTADSVTRIFSGQAIPSSNRPGSEDELEEFDFADMDKFREKIDALTLSSPPRHAPAIGSVQASSSQISTIPKQNSRPYQGHTENTAGPSVIASSFIGGVSQSDADSDPVAEPIFHGVKTGKEDVPHFAVDSDPPTVDSVQEPEDNVPTFYVDTEPSPVSVAVISDAAIALGENVTLEDDEDIIVYEAPRPRSKEPSNGHPSSNVAHLGPVTSNAIVEPKIPDSSAPQTPVPPSFQSISFSFATSPAPKAQPRYQPLASSTAQRVRARRKDALSKRKKRERQAMFSSFGAIVSEAQLRAQGPQRDPRWDERRRGDSDVDWGDESDEPREEKSTIQSKKDGGEMDVDPELELGLNEMMTFVNGMSSGESHFVTMDDIADIEELRREDEDADDDRGSSGDEDEEVDLVVNQEENAMIGDTEEIEIEHHETVEVDDDENDSVSSDGDVSPRAGFQARLDRLRRNAEGKRKAEQRVAPGSDDSSEGMEGDFTTWADDSEDFLAAIEKLLDEKDEIVNGRDRKAKNKLFRSIHDGDFDSQPRHRGDWQIPADLQRQWNKDRQTKAEKRRLRRQAMLEEASDPFSVKKAGKKSRKLIRAVANMDPSAPAPNRIFDMSTLVEQIQRFAANIDFGQSMALPPMAKHQRKQVHEIALAFNIKSQSKGKGANRYTTLHRTSLTGLDINERMIARSIANQNKVFGPKGKGVSRNPPPKDGDEVGKMAPKIGDSNIGFRMLQAMGWSEGDRIGISGGLHVPLTAIIKNTKLGLGASH